MTLSDTSPASPASLANLEASRAAFLAALASAPDAALRYRAPGEEYALGGLVEHVEGVMRHYTRVLTRMHEAAFGQIQVPDAAAEQNLAAIAAGLDARDRGAAMRRLMDAHAALIAAIRRTPPEDFTRTAPVVYGSAAEAYPTSAADVVNWLEQHYTEHAEHILGLLERWAAADTDHTREVIERFGEAFNEHKLETTLSLMTEDCVFDDTEPAPDGSRFIGKAQVGARFAAFFAGSPQATFTTEELFVCGDRAVVRWRYDWGGGHVRGVDVMKVREGLVAEKLAYVKG